MTGAPSSSPTIVDVDIVIATRNRAASFRKTLKSLAKQDVQPAQIVVVDGSDGDATTAACDEVPEGLRSQVRWSKATELGAAKQRNQGVARCDRPYVGFMDDDIDLHEHCFARMFAAIDGDSVVGGVNAMIVNQRYARPGLATRMVLRAMHGRSERSYAGKVVGPAVNMLPEDEDSLPEIVPIEWLNTTCCIYRREALPAPPFPPVFVGYSLMEDVCLSVEVAKKWKLVNARTARIFHDSQPGDHKRSEVELSRMELVNRHYVMATVLGRRRWRDYAGLWLWEAFTLAATLRRGPLQTLRAMYGKLQAMAILARGR